MPAEHAYELWHATCDWLPWLGVEAGAGIHPLRTSPTGYGVALLADRAKLVLRVPQRRLPDALTLAGKHARRRRKPARRRRRGARPLRPWATLQRARGGGRRR